MGKRVYIQGREACILTAGPNAAVPALRRCRRAGLQASRTGGLENDARQA